MNEQCVMKNILREACIRSVQVIETPAKRTENAYCPAQFGRKKKGRDKERKRRKGESSNQNPCFFSISGHQRASPSHFVRNFFLAFILFFQSHIAENEAEMTLLLPVCGDFD